MGAPTAELKAQVKISDYIGHTVALKPLSMAGSFVGLCPMHADHNPSLRVYDQGGKDGLGSFHCSPCGKHGDLFDWMEWVEKLPFVEALDHLADSVGYKGSRVDVQEARRRSERRKIQAIMGEATIWLAGQFTAKHAEVLVRNNLSPATCQIAQLGFGAPGFQQAMNSIGHTDADLERCGLLAPSMKDDQPTGELYFPLQNRIVIPFREYGEVSYMTGRHLAENAKPKYMHLAVNRPGVSEFVRRPMYGIDSVFGAEKVYVVEGPMDVLALQQRAHLLGEKVGVVAAMSNALTPEFARQLHTLAQGAEIVILADGEDAGISGALKSAELLAKAGSSSRIQLCPPGKDPASLGDDVATLRTPETPVEVWSGLLPALTDNKRAEAFNERLLPLLAVTPVTELDSAIQLLCPALGMDRGTLRAALSRYMKDAPAPEESRFSLTDTGNAERLIFEHGDDLHFSYNGLGMKGRWWTWAGKRWEHDMTGEVPRRAKATVNAMLAEAAKMDGKAQKVLIKHAEASLSAARYRSMLEVAQSELGVAIKQEEWDADPWILNTESGIVDLRTLAVSEPERSRLCTKFAPVQYVPGAECPLWIKFLDRVTSGDMDLQQFLQRAVGYTLTGDAGEECLFLLYGTGRNGKGTFIKTIQTLLGDYATTANFDTFLAKSGDSNSSRDIVNLVGARMAVAGEPDSHKRFSEGLLKIATGGDVVSGRFLYQEAFNFLPQFKLWLHANYKPIIRGVDPGIWSRIRLVPFTVYIPEEERDPNLKQKLVEELPGIFEWAMTGCAAWQTHGLGTCDAVKNATQEYREESDVLAGFVAEWCVTGPGLRVGFRELYIQYQGWSESNREKAMSQRMFNSEMKARGYQDNRGTHSGRSQWIGLGIRGDEEPDQKEMEA